ncbi:MAG: nucleoside transporter C-terminal domain-containing protein, partial [Myxococcota bacterium]
SIIVLFALVHLSNTVLGIIPLEAPLTLQGIAGWCLRPLMWLIGIPWAETHTAGQLMGTKTILNEFVAYLELSQMSGEFSDRSRLIVTYALCGFANLGSLGILVGGLDSLLPNRRKELARSAGLALLTGTLTTLVTASVVALLLSVGAVDLNY